MSTEYATIHAIPYDDFLNIFIEFINTQQKLVWQNTQNNKPHQCKLTTCKYTDLSSVPVNQKCSY